jgi:ABC-type Na+ transport system ATPase subunit NatA
LKTPHWRHNWTILSDNRLFWQYRPTIIVAVVCAGKSTTINVLTGVLPPTGGDAVVSGYSLTSPGGLDQIRRTMGVCPQFDVLWNELTGREHLQLFGSIKGLKDKAAVTTQASELLKEVRGIFTMQNSRFCVQHVGLEATEASSSLT